jgi:hypothetical protein
LIGQTLSHYRVTSALGAGGIGEVYRATDTALGRDVAIKVLPPEVARDPERLARFEREAKLLASLNHPNIAAIYGLEQADGKPFLALELVEGEDLKERIARGALAVPEALEIAQQIAEALEEAHGKGIVHRDLKPANVKLTADGKVKVLDFGLAKAWGADVGPGGSSIDLSQSPTLARTGTLAGVILGTAAYMAPEQAAGKAVDKRADVWSFRRRPLRDADRPVALLRRDGLGGHGLGHQGGAGVGPPARERPGGGDEAPPPVPPQASARAVASRPLSRCPGGEAADPARGLPLPVRRAGRPPLRPERRPPGLALRRPRADGDGRARPHCLAGRGLLPGRGLGLVLGLEHRTRGLAVGAGPRAPA